MVDLTNSSTDLSPKVKRFFNGAGRIAAFPAKAAAKLELLSFLAEQFDLAERYSESELDEVLARFYDDYVYLRRSLIEFGFFDRDPTTAMYWRTPRQFD